MRLEGNAVIMPTKKGNPKWQWVTSLQDGGDIPSQFIIAAGDEFKIGDMVAVTITIDKRESAEEA